MGTTSNGKIFQFLNCRILREHNIVKDDLWVRNGKILNPEKVFFDEKRYADVQIDCQNVIIAPGFIDVQINGAFGVDFSVDDENLQEGIKKVSKGLLAHGVTSYCPTLVTSTPHVYKKVLPYFAERNGSKEGAGILGVHAEGPFINLEKKGAHHPDYVSKFDSGFQSVLDKYGCLKNIKIVTLAPELPNAFEVTKKLTSQGITVSLGHSMANLSQGEKAVQNGASFITHLFNAMLPFHHRDPHLVGLLASNKIPKEKTVYYGMIADGIHTHPAALRIAQRTHPKGIVLVTDAIMAMGLPEGRHHLGHMTVDVKNQHAHIAGTDTLAGSIATMDNCVKHFFDATECTLIEALESASLHPAQLLGITDRKGSLNFDTDADFVFLDDNLVLQATYIAGECVWQSNTQLARNICAKTVK